MKEIETLMRKINMEGTLQQETNQDHNYISGFLKFQIYLSFATCKLTSKKRKPNLKLKRPRIL